MKQKTSMPASKEAVGEGLSSLDHSILCARLAHSKRAREILILDLRKLVSFTDYFVICSGRSDRQVQAIAEHLRSEFKAKKIRPRSFEGLSSGKWVLMDFVDVVVHIFQDAVREFYDLEGLWSDAPKVPLPPDLLDESKNIAEDNEEGDL